MTSLSPQMERLLGLMDPGRVYYASTLQVRFYGMEHGGHGYVNAGRGRGSGSVTNTLKALHRRGLVAPSGNGRRRVDA